MDLSANESMTKLRASATIIPSVGHSRVSPAEYLSPIAQVISNNPARSKACHALIADSRLVRLPLASVSPCKLREIARTLS